jgi:hypothetical protein
MMILIFIYIFQFSAPPKLLIRKVSDPFSVAAAFFWRWEAWGRSLAGGGRVGAGLLGLLELFLAENVIARIRCLPARRLLSSLQTRLVARQGVVASAVLFQSVYYNPFAASS